MTPEPVLFMVRRASCISLKYWARDSVLHVLANLETLWALLLSAKHLTTGVNSGFRCKTCSQVTSGRSLASLCLSFLRHKEPITV